MNERQIKLMIGCMLHDIGKVVYRSGDGRNHSASGCDYLKTEIGIDDKDVLDCVRYHHGANLKNAKISDDALAYITYLADNIAAAADRREQEDGEPGFDKKLALDSIFNILNGNHGKMHYEKMVLDVNKGINYPTDKTTQMDESFYKEVIRNVTQNLKSMDWSKEYVNSLLSVMEANLSYIPSSTSKRELADISLYDHVKMTAAIGSCIQRYLEENKASNYKEILFKHGEDFYKQKSFLLYSMDISGIQSFIYTISSKGALRGLRARSFYLELMMEHIIDELLERLELSRCNLIYCGGGHCYMLFPNTESTREIIVQQTKLVNNWFMNTFGTALYIGDGWSECCAYDLENIPEGSYEQLYRTLSSMISSKKMHRYDKEEIKRLNNAKHTGERECRICRKVDKLNADDCCSVCAALQKLSGLILYQDFFAVVSKPVKDALPLPGERYLIADTREKILKLMEAPDYVRCYTKNNIFTGKHVSTKLWVGDYTTGDSFDEFAEKAKGIERLAVLRADVDNLGTAFVSGFKQHGERYVTLSRTATLSRQLSLFFKCYINQLLEKGADRLLYDGTGKRNVSIVYSGGDDVFLVGSWNDVIEAALDLKNGLERFTEKTLTISAGVGIYSSGYPINIMAEEVANLEDASKAVDGKNAVTLFDTSMTYPWKTFTEKVLLEKYKIIKEFFDFSDERGKGFLYHLLELLRNTEERINTARYVYLLSRMEPGVDADADTRTAYKKFASNMYQWMKDEEDRRQTITALYLYVYLERERVEA